MSTHPTAVVDPNAKLGSDVEIGPFCVIGPHVELGDGCRLHSHVVIQGHTRIGTNCQVFPFASLGHQPQDIKYRGEPGRLTIGERTIVREGATIHAGTEGGGLMTRIGSDCFLMAYSHVAHDCKLGNHVLLANAAVMGGHCTIGDYAILGGTTALHQFVRIGDHAFIGGMSGAEADVIPFGMVVGLREGLTGLNIVGMKRRGFSREQILNLRHAYRMLFSDKGVFADRIEEVARAFPHDACVAKVVEFIRADSTRPLLVPKRMKVDRHD